VNTGEAWVELQEWLADLGEPVCEVMLEKMDELERKHE
jgi:hypothetical protein